MKRKAILYYSWPVWVNGIPECLREKREVEVTLTRKGRWKYETKYRHQPYIFDGVGTLKERPFGKWGYECALLNHVDSEYYRKLHNYQPMVLVFIEEEGF